MGSEETDRVMALELSLVLLRFVDLSFDLSQARWGAERLLLRSFSDGGSSVEPEVGTVG